MATFGSDCPGYNFSGTPTYNHVNTNSAADEEFECTRFKIRNSSTSVTMTGITIGTFTNTSGNYFQCLAGEYSTSAITIAPYHATTAPCGILDAGLDDFTPFTVASGDWPGCSFTAAGVERANSGYSGRAVKSTVWPDPGTVAYTVDSNDDLAIYGDDQGTVASDWSHDLGGVGNANIGGVGGVDIGNIGGIGGVE